MALPDLVGSDNEYVDSFASGDQELLLKAAGDAVRRYCGWHLFPSLEFVNRKLEMGEQGIIMLKSRYVTDVDSLSIDGRITELDYYDWFEEGYIQRKHHFWSRSPYCNVTYTHGYEELPTDLLMVVLELAQNAADMPSGVVGSFKTPGFGVTLSSGVVGAGLSDMQKYRLSPYKIGWTT